MCRVKEMVPTFGTIGLGIVWGWLLAWTLEQTSLAFAATTALAIATAAIAALTVFFGGTGVIPVIALAVASGGIARAMCREAVASERARGSGGG